MAITRQISRNALILQNTDSEVATAKTLSPYYEWTINGDVELLGEVPINSIHHIDSENVFYQIRTTARQAGTAIYRLKLVSYDVNGLNPITHMDATTTYSQDNKTYLLPLVDAFIPADRVIELRVQVIQGGSAAKDLSVTASLGKFTISSVFGSGAPVSSTPLVPFLNWTINGEVNLPIENAIGTLHYLEINKQISSVRITARKGGTSEYNFKVISRDINGLNPITHVDDSVVLLNDLQTYTIPITNAVIPVNRKIELVIFEQNFIVSAEDISFTIFLDEV